METEGAFHLAFNPARSGPFEYVRRDPESRILHQVIREHWQTFLSQAEQAGKALPFYVQREFEAFLTCGVLANGFVRLKCDNCQHEIITGLSCKCRGFCAACGSRRMAESGAFLTDHVFPRVPARQWVLSVPIPLRFLMAANPKLMDVVLRIATGVVSSYYVKKAKRRGTIGGKTGAVTFIQRSGNSVNFHPHFHQLWMEGVFVKNDKDPNGRALYRWVPRPTDDEVAAVLTTIRKRVVRALVKRGYLDEDETPTEECNDSFVSAEPLMASVMAASMQNRIALGERAGQRVRRVGSWGLPFEKAEFSGPLCASLGGFSLHANVFIDQNKPEKFEKLVRYMARSSIAESRIFRTENGDIGYMLKTPWNDGTFAVKFSPFEFLEKLVALIPPPRRHMTRFHGVLAPHHSWRADVVPIPVSSVQPSPGIEGEDVTPAKRKRLSWAELLKRVYKIDLTVCPLCSGTVRFVTAVMKRDVVIKILTYLKLPTAIPEWQPARSPPQTVFEF